MDILQNQLNDLHKKLNELRVSEAKWRSLVENSQDYILSIDLDLKVTFVSRFSLGFNAENTIGKHIVDDMTEPEFRDLTRNCFDHVRDHKTSTVYEYEARMRDGSSHYMMNRVAPVIINDELVSYNLTVIDISEFKRVQNELRIAKDKAEAANRAKSTFLANMSHELRTPLNSIIGYSEFLIDQAASKKPDDLVGDLHKIHNAGKNLLVMINDLLDISSIEAGRINITKKEFEISGLLEEVVNVIIPLAKKNQNQFVYPKKRILGSMISDVMKVKQSLLNLLGNACKFTEKGKITLNCVRKNRLAGEFIVFEVIDTGVGIDNSNFEKIFEAFAEHSTLTPEKHGGRGLGLAISRRFCRLLGGDILVESQVGKGSKFTIEVPAK